MLTMTPTTMPTTMLSTHGVWLLSTPTDMRKSFDGLLALAQTHCRQNVLDGGLFLFINKRRDRIKILYWDDDGLAIWYKRLEAGTFEAPTAGDQPSVTLTTTQLSLLLGGVDLASVKHRKRYQRKK